MSARRGSALPREALSMAIQDRILTLDDLESMARAMGLDLSRDRLAAILSEVQRLWEQARRLRELPLESEDFEVSFPIE